MGYAVLELEKLVENEDTGDSAPKEVTNRGEIVEGKSRERAVAREEGSKAGPWRNYFLASGASGSWRGRGEKQQRWALPPRGWWVRRREEEVIQRVRGVKGEYFYF